ncbi:MAG: Cu(I)-responsive transcriptional regulator [bacterium]|nr:MAG: Cu(I)-responsive transcriptional regulator [bacterium]
MSLDSVVWYRVYIIVMETGTMTIGKIAKAASVGIETIRYYERRQLIAPVYRKPSGYRVYDQTSVQKIRFIKNAQRLGFKLEEIIELLKLKVSGNGQCGSVRKKAEAKMLEIEGKIAALGAIKKSLKNLIKHCRDDRPTDDCPILNGMEAITGNLKK